MKIQSLSGDWQFCQAGTTEWLPGRVPGGVHTDLLALERIPDPFYGDNEKAVQWVADSDWTYRRTFDVDQALLAEDRIFLVCDSLDTLARVHLNGTLLGQTNNMFRRYRWQVKPLLKATGNELVIDFASPTRYCATLNQERPMPAVDQLPGAPYLRKAPCQFGWDWGPMLPPIGIPQDIRLEGRKAASLSDVHLRQHHQDGRVALSAAVTLERWAAVPLVVRLTVTTPTGETLETETALTDDSVTLSQTIDQPQLWWPNGYGDQPRYTVRITLSAGDIRCDQADYTIGLRTIDLSREPDEWGESFYFVVNGVPVFAKGADWIPADSFPTRISDDHLERLIRDAAAANFNMLRIWGGGFYEEDRFYELCERYGIMIWQDFVFACSVYPLHQPEFVDNVVQEARENIRRLRHRTSLALWSGNNEMEWMWTNRGWDVPENQDLKEAYEQFFYHTLADLCAAEDPDTPYWPSSPSSNEPFQDPNGQHKGNTHYWEVWHGRKPFTAYRDQFPRFMSEFGFQSLPPLETVRTYAEEKDWNMTAYIMEHHQRSPAGNGLIIAQMTQTFRMPKDFPALTYLSMVLQAEGIRYGVEHWRRSRQRVAGTLYWQHNDCWPVASWASQDYFGRWKALHYAAKRFYAPLLLSIEDAPPQMGLYLTTDRVEPWRGTVRWSLETLTGEVLDSGQNDATAAPLATTKVAELNFSGQISDDNERELVFVSELWQGDERLTLSIATFVPNKHLALVDPQIETRLTRMADNEVTIHLNAQSLARFVELSFAGADVVFSDNYFDLPAGRTITVTAPLPPGWDTEKAFSALQIRSLYNSFA